MELTPLNFLIHLIMDVFVFLSMFGQKKKNLEPFNDEFVKNSLQKLSDIFENLQI